MTLRLRLTIYWAAVFALLLIASGVAVFWLFQRQQWAALDAALLEEADTSAQMITRLGPDSAQAVVVRLSAERDLGPSRRVAIVSHGITLADAGNPAAPLPPIDLLLTAPKLLNGRDLRFRYAVVPFKFDGAGAYIIDGVDAQRLRDPITKLRNSLLLTLPLILLISVSAGYWLAGRALLPLIEVTSGLAVIKPRDRARRLPLPPADDEVARLVHAINALLDRVERASATERRFAADAAHELRTPLTILRSGIEVTLNRPREAAEYAQALATALSDVIALGATADELLTLSRLDQELALVTELIDWTSLAAEAITTIEPLAQSRWLTLRTDLQSNVIVNGNRNYLRRLLNNLLDNALKFTPDHGLIEVTLEARDGHAALRIADNGPGIPEAELPFIFDRFFHGKSRREAGNGLGLSLCHEIAQLHGGTLTASNRVNSGAEFIVLLPVASVQP
jgi:two-component system, OmpR family, sensor kinase